MTLLPAGSNAMTLTPDNGYGGSHHGQSEVSAMGIEVVTTDPQVTWQLQMTQPGGENLQASEVEDVLLVLGYEWE